LVNILESAPLRNIGRISYGAYLIHNFLHFSLIEHLLQRFGVGAPPTIVQVLVELAGSLIVAGLSWQYLEKPSIALAAGATSRGTFAVQSRAATGPMKSP
jgi:peptidoglycan/LPS O-acetylase OafA/YrhL